MRLYEPHTTPPIPNMTGRNPPFVEVLVVRGAVKVSNPARVEGTNCMLKSDATEANA